MKTIISLTNFSAASFNAANYAADMAQALGADLVLAHIIQMPASFDMPVTEYEFDVLLENAEEALNQLKKELQIRTEDDVNISTKVLSGNIATEIEEVCEGRKPLLFVIGSERGSRVERVIFGSHTFSNIKSLHYPVLVVPQDAIFRHIRRIGLASDFQDIHEVPFEILDELVESFDASVDIIHVSRSKEDELKNALPYTLLKRRLRKFEPKTLFVINDNIEDAINDCAGQNHEDMLMVVARKHNFLEAIGHKSRSNQIALRPHIPVLAIAE